MIEKCTGTDRMIFITGGTGLMGSHLTFKALAAGCPVCVLVREKGLLSPHERFRRVAEFFGYSDSSFEELLPRVKFVAGDITRRRFGMSKPDWSRLADGVDEVIHAAAFIGTDACDCGLSPFCKACYDLC